MQLAEWQIGGVLMGGVQAAFLLLNQHFRIPARILMLWRGFGVFAVLLPAALLVDSWPGQGLFYLLSAASGLLIGVFDRMSFHAVMQYGAGAVSRLMALCLPVSFVLWGLLHPGHFSGLAEKPLAFLIPLALLGVVVSLLFMRRSPLGRVALVALIPAYFIGGAIDVLNKSAMLAGSGHGFGTYLAYGSLTALVSGLVNLFWAEKDAAPLTLSDVFSPPILRGGSLVVACACVFLLLKTSSLVTAPNPAFLAALALLSPVWVILWNRFKQIPDDSNLLAGLGCVISAFLLVLATV